MNRGQIIGGYRIEEVIGRGGLGVVYRAVQLGVGRDVALKMMLPRALAGDEGHRRFRREAELAKRLEHPNTVRLYDIGESEDGVPFIVWELLKGRALDTLLAEDGPLATERVAHIAGQTLKSLMEAHALGIIHRDIKPSNLFVCAFMGERDFIKVLDFGIAKAVDMVGLTRDHVIGTPAYMSPEQVAGGDVSPASDLYALGLVLAESLSGRAVFAGDSAIAVALAQRSPEPAPLPREAVESALGAAIVRATRKDPSLRFQSAAEMFAAVEAAVHPSARGGAIGWPTGDPGVRIVPSSAPLQYAETALAPRSVTALRRNGAILAVAASLGALSVGAVFLSLHRREPAAKAALAPSEHPARALPRSSGSHPTRSVPPLRLAQMTPKILRERLAQLGWSVLNEQNTAGAPLEITTFTVIREGSPMASLILFRCDSASSAAGAASGKYERVVRDGNVVLATPVRTGATRALTELGY